MDTAEIDLNGLIARISDGVRREADTDALLVPVSDLREILSLLNIFREEAEEYGASWLEGESRVFVPTEDDWRATVEVDRMNAGYQWPEENYVVRRRPAGPWMRA